MCVVSTPSSRCLSARPTPIAVPLHPTLEMTSMLVTSCPSDARIPGFPFETSHREFVFTVSSPELVLPGFIVMETRTDISKDEPGHLRPIVPKICTSQPSIRLCNSPQSSSPTARPVFFKARKLDSVAKIAFENELTKPKYQGELGEERMQEVIAALTAKMHWAVQVGGKKYSKTYELQRSPTGSKITLVTGVWTQEEKNLQITDYVKNEYIGSTTMTDEEIKEICK